MISCFRPPKKYRKQSMPQNRTMFFLNDSVKIRNRLIPILSSCPLNPIAGCVIFGSHNCNQVTTDNDSFSSMWRRFVVGFVQLHWRAFKHHTTAGHRQGPVGWDSSGSFILCNVSNTSVWQKCWKRKCQEGANTADHPFILSSEHLLFFCFSPIADQI